MVNNYRNVLICFGWVELIDGEIHNTNAIINKSSSWDSFFRGINTS